MRAAQLSTSSEIAATASTIASDRGGSWLTRLVIHVGTQSWLMSMVVHLTLFVLLALTLGTIKVAQTIGNAPTFAASDFAESDAPELARIELTEPPPEPPTVLDADVLLNTGKYSDLSRLNGEGGIGPEIGAAEFTNADSLPTQTFGPIGVTPFSDVFRKYTRGPGDGPATYGDLSLTPGKGMSLSDARRILREGTPGGPTKPSERAVAAALQWIARHQSQDGSWSLDHTSTCKSGYCSGPGNVESPAAGTGLALLTFLAAGQTHESKGPYQKHIAKGLNYLLKNQARNGDLATTGQQQMYTHGLCTIALCEAYGMTSDSRVGLAAQAAIDFVQSGQNNQGGWRYSHGALDSDTSVFGWQVMALKSGQMAGLKVDPQALVDCQKYLKLCSSGKYRSEFGYVPGSGSTHTMTSVGLLASQYLGAERSDPVVVGGIDYLMKRQPAITDRNSYYWYYATQAMHNAPGPEWDTWNRKMRRILIESQEKTGCQAGSWNPEQPTSDPWGKSGGRLMVTTLSTLTLEVYYRYLPLYQMNAEE
jgi:hypothetical protein